MSAKKPVTGADNKRVRYTIELTKRLDDSLEKVASESGTTKAEALRFAIEFLQAGIEAKNDGMVVGGFERDEAGQLKRERVFIGL